MLTELSSPIALRASLDIKRPNADRALLVGMTNTGKSTLANYLIHCYRQDYVNAKDEVPRVLVLDTKPRWRAEYLADGTHAQRRYKKMAQGDIIPGSFALERLQDWPLVWDRNVNPSQVVIVQNIHARQAANVILSVMAAEKFFRSQDARRPSLIYFDEGMDFYTPHAAARGGSDIVQRCVRAGRERTLSTVFGAQRPVGINLQLLTEMSYCALFRIRYRKDVRRLWDMGWPTNVLPPTYEDGHAFRLWRDTGPDAPMYVLTKESESERRAG